MARRPGKVKISGKASASRAKFEESKYRRGAGGKFADKPGAGDDAPRASRAASQTKKAIEGAKAGAKKTSGVTKTDVITVNVKSNPKKPGSASHAHFEGYSSGMTVQQFIDGHPGGKSKALADLAWDQKKGFVSFSAPKVEATGVEIKEAQPKYTDDTLFEGANGKGYSYATLKKIYPNNVDSVVEGMINSGQMKVSAEKAISFNFSTSSSTAPKKTTPDDILSERWKAAGTVEMRLTKGSRDAVDQGIEVHRAAGLKTRASHEDEDVQFYTGSGYESFNKSLRDGEMPRDLDGGAARVGRMDKLVASSSFKTDTIMYRGISNDSFNNMPPPNDFSDGAFGSVSFVADVSKGFAGYNREGKRQIFRVLVPAGTPGIMVNRQWSASEKPSYRSGKTAHGMGDEAEVLLPRNVRYVYSAKTTGRIGGTEVEIIDVNIELG